VRDPAFTTVSADAVTMDDIAQAIGEKRSAWNSFTAMQTELEGHVAARAFAPPRTPRLSQ